MTGRRGARYGQHLEKRDMMVRISLPTSFAAAALGAAALGFATLGVTGSAAAAGKPSSSDTVRTVQLPGGVMETLTSGPVKPVQSTVAPLAAVGLLTTCNPTCGTGGIMPPVTLADTHDFKYSALNGDLEASESSNLTGGQGFPTYNTQFGSNTATFYWLGTSPSFNWQSYSPGFTWTQTGINVSGSVPAGVGFSGGGQVVQWSGGQGGSGNWEGTISYGQKVGFASNIATTAKFESTAAVWLGGNAYGITATSSDSFGPVA